MKIKIKGVCVDINKPRTQEDLTRLLNVCKSEASTASGPRKSFIIMIIKMIDNKLMKEYNNQSNKIKVYEKTIELA
tara:strand:+ start:1562 stop:1789 length:228 start_codon:yes stop_codon:yes gene_type:complete